MATLEQVISYVINRLPPRDGTYQTDLKRTKLFISMLGDQELVKKITRRIDTNGKL